MRQHNMECARLTSSPCIHTCLVLRILHFIVLCAYDDPMTLQSGTFQHPVYTWQRKRSRRTLVTDSSLSRRPLCPEYCVFPIPRGSVRGVPSGGNSSCTRDNTLQYEPSKRRVIINMPQSRRISQRVVTSMMMRDLHRISRNKSACGPSSM